jgi:hypothetical protein
MSETKNLPTAPAPARSQAMELASENFAAMFRAIESGSVNVDALEKMAAIQLQLIDRERETEFHAAKAAALNEMPIISRRGAILNSAGKTMSRYAKFEDIMAVVRPILQRHNLVVSFDIGNSDKMVTVQCILAHAGNGWTERSQPMSLPIDTTGAKNATQGSGSAASYGKRNQLCAVLNIVTQNEDDDGTGRGVQVEQLGVDDSELVAEAQRQAAQGVAAYSAWFKGETNMRKGRLMDLGWHDKLKEAARIHDEGVKTDG